uniref:Uncharacterized protein n=1 Tax=Rhabditophanes sp. KR3021 TaxID=114890 RepID=A0AC35UEG3_9BILA
MHNFLVAEIKSKSVNGHAEMNEDLRRNNTQKIKECTLAAFQLKLKKADFIGYHPYKLQVVQKLEPEDRANRMFFAETELERLEEDDTRLGRLFFSDEIHFHMDSTVNRHNHRYWATENPNWYQEVPLHSEKTTVWAGIYEGGIIGPFFFDETVNGVRNLKLTDPYNGTITKNGITDNLSTNYMTYKSILKTNFNKQAFPALTGACPTYTVLKSGPNQSVNGLSAFWCYHSLTRNLNLTDPYNGTAQLIHGTNDNPCVNGTITKNGVTDNLSTNYMTYKSILKTNFNKQAFPALTGACPTYTVLKSGPNQSGMTQFCTCTTNNCNVPSSPRTLNCQSQRKGFAYLRIADTYGQVEECADPNDTCITITGETKFFNISYKECYANLMNNMNWTIGLQPLPERIS